MILITRPEPDANKLKKIFVNFKLILILNIRYSDVIFPENVSIYHFNNYSSDWRFPNIMWNDIFNDN